MFDYIHLLALKLGYMQIFFTICIFFLFASLFVIGRYQWLMKRFSKEYYPARKYQEKNLCKYKDKCPSVYINSYYLYKNNPELKMDQARGKYLSYSFFKIFICQINIFFLQIFFSLHNKTPSLRINIWLGVHFFYV